VLRTKIKIMSSISEVIELLTDMKNRAASLRHQCYVSPIIAMGVIIEIYIFYALQDIIGRNGCTFIFCHKASFISVPNNFDEQTTEQHFE